MRARFFGLQTGLASSGTLAAFVLLLFTGSLLPHPVAAQVKEGRRVLVFNDFGSISSPGIAEMDQEIFKALESSRYQIEFYNENLEVTLFSEETSQPQFREWYIRRYSNHRPDVIITVGPAALRFILEMHDEPFKDTPVVFCGIMEVPGGLRADSRFTGAWSDVRTEETMDAALRLQPGTRHVVVVGGVGSLDRQGQAIVREKLRGYESKLDFTYLTDLSMPNLLEQLKLLPRDTVVLHTAITQDAAGERFIDATQAVPMVAEAASAPVFVLDDVDVRGGAVGGDVLSWAATARDAAKIAVRILNGEKPQDIPIVRSDNLFMFDWQALQRWGFKEGDLPPGSEVLNRETSFWESYKQYVIVAFFLFLAQALAIAGLLWQRARRREAQVELVRSHERQGESEQRFRLAMGNVASGLYTVDLQSLVTYVNPAAESMFGWTGAELIGKKMHDVTHYKHPDGTPFPASECPGLEALQEGTELREHEDMFIRKDGSFFPVVYSASPLKKDGQTFGLVVGFRDDTQRRAAERVVRENEERFRLIANATPVMIWMSGVNKLSAYFNQGWLEFTGRSLNEELGNGWTEGVHPEDLARWLETYTQAFDRHEPFTMEYRFRRNDGAYRWVFDRGVPRFELDGSFAGYIGSCVDVTERKLAEEIRTDMSRKLLEVQEQERARIARELHDDISQQLALLSAEIQQMKESLPASDRELRSQMEALQTQASEISTDIQSLSHELHSSKLEYLGLVLAMKSFCKEFEGKHKATVDFDSEGVPPSVPQEVALCLFRVMQEGLRNALKHSGVQSFEVNVRGSPTEIWLSIRDSGVGFEPESAKGAQGLGLISMQERVRLVNGTISITSRPQSGAEVFVFVPLSDGTRAEQTKSAGA